MIVIEVYACTKGTPEHITTAYTSSSLYDEIHAYWQASESNKTNPIVLKRVNKREEDKESDRDFKDWVAEKQYQWFVLGDDRDLI